MHKWIYNLYIAQNFNKSTMNAHIVSVQRTVHKLCSLLTKKCANLVFWKTRHIPSSTLHDKWVHNPSNKIGTHRNMEHMALSQAH